MSLWPKPSLKHSQPGAKVSLFLPLTHGLWIPVVTGRSRDTLPQGHRGSEESFGQGDICWRPEASKIKEKKVPSGSQLQLKSLSHANCGHT